MLAFFYFRQKLNIMWSLLDNNCKSQALKKAITLLSVSSSLLLDILTCNCQIFSVIFYMKDQNNSQKLTFLTRTTCSSCAPACHWKMFGISNEWRRFVRVFFADLDVFLRLLRMVDLLDAAFGSLNLTKSMPRNSEQLCWEFSWGFPSLEERKSSEGVCCWKTQDCENSSLHDRKTVIITTLNQLSAHVSGKMKASGQWVGWTQSTWSCTWGVDSCLWTGGLGAVTPHWCYISAFPVCQQLVLCLLCETFFFFFDGKKPKQAEQRKEEDDDRDKRSLREGKGVCVWVWLYFLYFNVLSFTLFINTNPPPKRCFILPTSDFAVDPFLIFVQSNKVCLFGLGVC